MAMTKPNEANSLPNPSDGGYCCRDGGLVRLSDRGSPPGRVVVRESDRAFWATKLWPLICQSRARTRWTTSTATPRRNSAARPTIPSLMTPRRAGHQGPSSLRAGDSAARRFVYRFTYTVGVVPRGDRRAKSEGGGMRQGPVVGSIACGACGNQVSSAALQCPRCGHPIAVPTGPARSAAPWASLAGLLALLVAGAISWTIYTRFISPSTRDGINQAVSITGIPIVPWPERARTAADGIFKRQGETVALAIQRITHREREDRTPLHVLGEGRRRSDMCRCLT